MVRALELLGSGGGDAAAFNAALDACRQVGQWGQALRLYDAMLGSGVALERPSYEAAMAAAMALRRHGVALEVFEKLQASLAGGEAPSRARVHGGDRGVRAARPLGARAAALWRDGGLQRPT